LCGAAAANSDPGSLTYPKIKENNPTKKYLWRIRLSIPKSKLEFF
jgi:hypothetical protein